MRRKWFSIALLIAAAGGAQTIAAPPATELSKTPTVAIDNFHFNPATLTVTAGTSVTWINKDDVPHTATGKGETPLFDSGTLDTDEKFSFTFTAPGTYVYYCKVHPHMTGTVVVK